MTPKYITSVCLLAMLLVLMVFKDFLYPGRKIPKKETKK